MALVLTPMQAADSVQGIFTFYADAAAPNVASGSGILQGTYKDGRLDLTWKQFTLNPAGYIGVNLSGSLVNTVSGVGLSGTVTALPGGSACTTFSLRRG